MKTHPVKHPLQNDFYGDWAVTAIQEMFPTFCSDLIIYTDDIIYSRKLEVFRGSKILIIGGGPSSQLMPTVADIRRCYDDVWSMNNFFMNAKLSYIPMSLLMFGANTQLSDPRLGEYIEKHKPYLVFEPHPKYGVTKTVGHYKNPDWNNARRLVNAQQYNHLKCACQTAFWSRIGIGARMLVLAGHLQAKLVHFIGIDGFTSYKTGNHYFEKGKGPETLPSSIQAMPENTAKAVYLEEYRQLAEELHTFKGVTSYKNLGSEHKLNDIGDMLDQ